MTEHDGILIFSELSDGSGLLEFDVKTVNGWIEVSSVKVWDGVAWVNRPLMRFNGSTWEAAKLRVWAQAHPPL